MAKFQALITARYTDSINKPISAHCTNCHPSSPVSSPVCRKVGATCKVDRVKSGAEGLLLRLGIVALLVVSAIAIDELHPAWASSALATPSSPSSNNATFTTIGSGLSISGFTSDIRVVVSTDDASGELKLTTTTGLTAVSGYDNSSSLTDAGNEIAFEASQSNANTALASLQYKGATAGTDTISVEVLEEGIVPVEISGVYHYYGLSTGSTVNWGDANTGATTQKPLMAIQSLLGSQQWAAEKKTWPFQIMLTLTPG